jgi:hypothetical protein
VTASHAPTGAREVLIAEQHIVVEMRAPEGGIKLTEAVAHVAEPSGCANPATQRSHEGSK